MSRALEDEEKPLSGDPSPGRPERHAHPVGRLYRLITLGIWIAVIAFVVIGIGWPLIGHGIFGPTDVLARRSPYGDTVLAGLTPLNPYLQDVADGVLPQTALFTDLFRQGLGGSWNPFMVGGTPLGAVPNNSFFNPLSLPFFVLPTWFAPAWVKVFEIGVSVGGVFLFARRLGLGRPAAFTGGLVFATSAFMMAWTGWAQTRTAAFIPLLFWAVERLVQRRRVGDAVLVCLATAAMLLGGFPAVTGYALVAGGIYFLVRLVARYPGQWKRITRVAAGGAAAIGGAVSLAAFQLLPFSYFMSNAFVWGREQTPGDHIPFRALITAIAPWALGTTYPGGQPQWAPGTHLIEALSYVGAATLLLALVGVAAVRAGRALLPKGVWVFLVAGIGVVMVLIYAGGPPLAVAQQLPVLFSDNFVGRARSVLGFLIAVLAAVGFELLHWRLKASREKRTGLATRLWGPAVWVGAALGIVGLVFAARGLAADHPGRAANFDRQVLIGLAFVTVAAACVAVAWWSRGGWTARAARAAALVGIPVLIAAQALTFVLPYWARADRETFYPETDVHRYLAGHLGHERYASPPNTLMSGESSIHRMRALGGHAFSDERMGQVLDALPGKQFKDPPTMPMIIEKPEVVASPILDRLAVRYYVSAPWAPVIGTPYDIVTDDTSVSVTPGTPITARIQHDGPLRAVVLRVTEPIRETTELDVSVRDPAGREVASGERTLVLTNGTVGVHVPVLGEDVPAGTPLTATLTTHGGGDLVLGGQGGKPALTTIGPADDGLRVVMSAPSVIYERDRALPRIRWAGTADVEPDAGARVSMLAGGDVGADHVLLDGGTGGSTGGAGGSTGGAGGSTGTVDIVEDGTETIEVAVAADGAGYLVVADALQHGWQATVDGEPAELLAADHAVVAIAVGEGRHTVRLSYASPYGGAGYWLSGATVVVLLAAVLGERWWRRRRTTSEPIP